MKFRPPPKYPSKCHPSGQARIWVPGQGHVYLGVHGSEASWREYARIVEQIRERQTSPDRPAPQAPSRVRCVADLLLAYTLHAEAEHAAKRLASRQLDRIKRALGWVRRHAADWPVGEFDQLALEATRQRMVDADLSRGYINSLVGCIRRCWRWAALRRLVPADHHARLRLLPDLRRGRGEARETARVRPVSQEHIDATLPGLLPELQAMVRVQLATGMRTGELCGLTMAEVDTSGHVWVYRPSRHKNSHKGQDRTILLGPAVQALLTPFIPDDPTRPVFSPRRAMQARALRRSLARRSKATPRQRAAMQVSAVKRHLRLRDHYTPTSYAQAIARACARSGIPPWRPYQLRHAAATRIRTEHGPDLARVLLGHKSLAATEIYAEVDLERLKEIAE